MYIFETSWEVCNRVGGIYAVLSTRAASMQRMAKDKVIFIGPDLQAIFGAVAASTFIEENNILSGWRNAASHEGLHVRIGRWRVPGEPLAVLIDFRSLYPKKDSIYAHVWEQFGVRSHAAYGDYDESSLFGYYAGEVICSLNRFLNADEPAVAHFNEWQTSFGIFYLKEYCRRIATLFTTHATCIGRSIAGNGKPLYDYFHHYDGNQMAEELNMVSKHSAEREAAHNADCFTTVSDITARECEQLLDKKPDIVTPNGFEPDFVPKGTDFTRKRNTARKALRHVAEEVCGYSLLEDTLFVCISGRFEWKNKGIDAFLHSIQRLSDMQPKRTIVAFMMIPGWQSGPKFALGKDDHWTTHRLCNYTADPVIRMFQQLGLWNIPSSRVKVVYVPSYLNGDDGIFNLSYYDILIGMDATIFPSYYEPWGYTPLESAAFRVPTITTNLSGFGQWVESHKGADADIEHGVEVVPRTDSNWNDMIQHIASALYRFAQMNDNEIKKARKGAADTAEKAEWKHFFKYYEQAYQIALNKSNTPKS